MKSLHKRVLKEIVEVPGTSAHTLGRLFDLNGYRLKRVFRQIDGELEGSTLVNDDENGVWIVGMDPDKCQGTEWLGADQGGYSQCDKDPEFADGCCYFHSTCQNLEMVAFEQRLRYVAGPCEPTAYGLGRLSLILVENLLEEVDAIAPFTHRDALLKTRFRNMLQAAVRFLRWRDMMRRRSMGTWIPPEFERRHRESSVNPFEFSLRRFFLVLEVPAESTKEEVLKAWRQLAKRYHPDTADGDEERMKAINYAKERIFRIRGWD